jgi:hypothetical protein
VSARGLVLLVVTAAALGSVIALVEHHTAECHRRRCEHGEPVYDLRVGGDSCWCRERAR